VTPTATPVPPPSDTLDSFLCYKVRRARGGTRFEEQGVSLDDQFQARTVDIFKTEQLCNPVQVTQKNSQGNNVTFPIIDPTAHLTCYNVGRPASTEDPEVVSTDQFGEQQLRVRKRKTQLCIPSNATSLAPTPTPTASATPTAAPNGMAPPLEHFELYRAKTSPGQPISGEPKFERQNVDLVDPLLGLDETVTLTRPVRLGVPTDKNEEGITNSMTHLTCFSLLAPRFKWQDVSVENQFVDEEGFGLKVRKPKMLCVPSYKMVIDED
jgi:hypothetical protein